MAILMGKIAEGKDSVEWIWTDIRLISNEIESINETLKEWELQ
jgi:hypothetical protein